MKIVEAPVYIFWKDIHSVFLGCNNHFADVAGLSSPEEIRGKTDFDLPWRDTDALLYREGDQAVLDGLIKVNEIEAQSQSGGRQASILINKIPLTDALGQKIGIIGTYTDISIESHVFRQDAAGLNLSERQFECLIMLVQGMSFKEIGKLLQLSPRTVEHYIDTVKAKLHCDSRSELIKKALRFDVVKRNL